MTHITSVPNEYASEACGVITAQEFSHILEQNQTNCLFCTPASPKKIIFETDSFYVTLDDSPLIEGHILIHSKLHYGCAGELPSDLFEELLILKNHIQDLLMQIYGVCSFYEHGRAGHCSISQDETLCEHFHLHALPLTEDISSDIAQTHQDIQLKSFEEIPQYFEQYDQYLLFAQGETVHFYPVLTEIPSHFLRTVIATRIGKPERADWSQAQNLAFINAFKEKLKSHHE